MTISQFDQKMMQRALQLAHRGRYRTRPNPAVGCVIVRDQHILAEGWHQKAGQLHAERLALAQAAEKGVSVEGATVYVTLEPCSHFGRTPPCSHALVEAKVGRVVVAMQDPNPLVAGRGLDILRSAGIEVDVGVCEEQAQALNRLFNFAMQAQRPFITLKMAMSLDGRTAMSSGESQWITGAKAREAVHLMRAGHPAILTGVDTVLADDPSLTVRLTPEQLQTLDLESVFQPLKVILDTQLRLPLTAKLLQQSGKTLVFTGLGEKQKQAEKVHALAELGVEVCEVARGVDQRLNLEAVFTHLWQVHQIQGVLVEAGATLAGSLVQSGWVDELQVFVAPDCLGSDAKALFNLPGLVKMADKVQFEFNDVERLGRDLRLSLRPIK